MCINKYELYKKNLPINAPFNSADILRVYSFIKLMCLKKIFKLIHGYIFILLKIFPYNNLPFNLIY